MYSEGETFYVRVLQIRDKQLGAHHPDTATSLNNLASLYGSQGKYSEAEPLYVRALHISEEQLGAHHPQTQQVMKNYSTLLAQNDTNGETDALLELLPNKEQDKDTDEEATEE